MKFQKNIFTVIGVAIFYASPIYSQNVDDRKTVSETSAIHQDESLLEKKIQEKLDLKREVEELSAAKKNLEEQLKQKNKESNGKQKLVTNVKNDIKKLKAGAKYKKFTELSAIKDSLEKCIEQTQKDIISMQSDITNIGNELKDVNEKKGDLENVKKNVADELINSNKKYLDRPFSEMDTKHLSSLDSDCSKYRDDERISKFWNDVKKVSSQKRIFDRANGLLNQSYSKDNIANSLLELKTMDCRTAQRSEVQILISKLTGFKKALDTFKEFIKAYAQERQSISSDNDYKETIDMLLAQANLKSRIETDVKSIPYLNRKWDEYIKAINKDHKTETTTEKEILQQ